MARSHIFTIFAEERRIVDGEQHAHCGFINRNRRQCLGVFEIRNGISDFKTVDTHDSADVSASHLIDIVLSEPFEHHKLFDLMFLHHIVALAETHLRAGAKASPRNFSNGNTPYIRRIFERRNQHLRSSLDHGRCRDFLENDIKQICYVVGRFMPVRSHPALLCRAVNGFEVKLLLSGVQIEHQVENFLLHLIGTAVGLVHLVDNHYGLQTDL